MQKSLFLLLILSFIFSCQQNTELKSDSIHAIPLDAAIIIESNDLSSSISSLTNSTLWATLSTETSIKNTQKTLFSLDSNLAIYASHLSSINPVFLSIHLTGAKSFNWLLVSSTENQEQKIQLLEIGLESFAKKKLHNYSHAVITEVLLDETTLYYAKLKGLLMLSEEKILIEDAIRQLKTPNNLTASKAFNNIYNSANKKEDFNVYLNTQNFDRISKALLQENSRLNTQAEWMQWDTDISKNGVLFSGISLSYDSLAQELSFYEGNDGHKAIAPTILPKNTAVFVSKSFENFKQFKRKYLNSLITNHLQNEYTKSLSGLKPELNSTFESWIDSEVSWFMAENSSNLAEGLIAHIANESEVNRFLKENTDSLFDYRQQDIFKWDQLKYFASISTYQTEEELIYASLINDQLIICADLGMLKNLINDNKAEKSLSETEDYKSCMEELNSSSNLFVYAQNPSALKLAPNYLNSELTDFTINYAEALDPFRSLGIQFEANSTNCYSNAYLHFNNTETDQTRAIWTRQLEAPILSEISLVKNHYNQQWEIVVQDEKLNLYLISTEGEVLWKRKLQQAIIGEVKQIDLFKNKKLQLVFNTANKLYLIDRKGRDVGAYPVILPNTTSLPLALFDYQKQRNYRILLSCGTHHYMYDKYGKRIKGWKLDSTKSKAVHSAQHYVVASKDYILLPEENGKLNILNRRGETRIKVKEKIEFSNNPLNVIKGTKLADTRIVTIDKNGIQQNILFDGSIDNSLQFEFDERIYYNYEQEHHTLLEGDELKVNGPQMNLHYSFESEELSKPKTWTIENQTYTSITDYQNEEAYLFRNPNDLIDGFPLYGQTSGILKDIDLDKKLNFIIGGESGMIYNYSAE